MPKAYAIEVTIVRSPFSQIDFDLAFLYYHYLFPNRFSKSRKGDIIVIVVPRLVSPFLQPPDESKLQFAP